MPRLRGPPTQTTNQKAKSKAKPKSVTSISAPDSIGTIIRPGKPIVNRTANGATISGQDFIGTVEANGVSTFGLGKSALLSPAYFVSSYLGNLARSYEKYKWNRLRVTYVPRVSTGLTGQCILASQRSVSEPCLQPENASFLQRVMTQGNATMGPLWLQNSIDIDCSGDWKLIDPATNVDLDDAIHEELQVFTQTGTAGTVGYLMAEYSVSFREPIFQPHSTTFPMPTGPGQRIVMLDSLAVNAANDAWQIVDGTPGLGLSSIPNGAIYRIVFDLQGSTCYTGGTFANGFNISASRHSTTAALASQTSTLVVVGGMTFYGVVYGSALNVYTSLEAAVNGVGSGQVYYKNASTVLGSYIFDAQLVRYGITILPTVQ